MDDIDLLGEMASGRLTLQHFTLQRIVNLGQSLDQLIQASDSRFAVNRFLQIINGEVARFGLGDINSPQALALILRYDPQEFLKAYLEAQPQPRSAFYNQQGQPPTLSKNDLEELRTQAVRVLNLSRDSRRAKKKAPATPVHSDLEDLSATPKVSPRRVPRDTPEQVQQRPRLAKEITRLRSKHKLSRSKLAQLSGVPAHTIANAEMSKATTRSARLILEALQSYDG